MMKRVVRYCCFETNSSSVHSLVIDSSGMESSDLPIDNNGYIIVSYNNFDSEFKEYSSQEDKLSYLITQCYYLGGWNYHLDRDENHHFRHIEDAICEYTGARGIKVIGGEPYIDHQEIPDYDLNFVDEWNSSSIQNFVFNKYIKFKTDRD